MEEQPNTAQFQNKLYHDLLKLEPSKRIWIESESLSIGRVYLPQSLWETMNRSSVIEIEIDKSIRAKRIVEEYGHIETHLLASSIEKIKSRFGGDRVNKAIKMLEEGKLEEVTTLLLEYYDKSYTYSKNKYKEKEVSALKATTGDPLINARELQKIADKLSL
jgi:tRNA 2-selenouridine synthase